MGVSRIPFDACEAILEKEKPAREIIVFGDTRIFMSNNYLVIDKTSEGVVNKEEPGGLSPVWLDITQLSPD